MRPRPPLRSRASRASVLLLPAALGGAFACARRVPVADGPAGAARDVAAPPRSPAEQAAADSARGALLRRAGRATAEGELPFVVVATPLAGAAPESTLVVVALALAPRALTFARETTPDGAADGYRATYAVRVEARPLDVPARADLPGPGPTRSATADETVRVATLRETTRATEAVLFTRPLALPAGRWALAVSVRDGGSARSGTARVPTLVVPRLVPTPAPSATGAATDAATDAATGAATGAADGAWRLAPPVPVLAATPRASVAAPPTLVPNVVGTVAFGQDTTVLVYLEAYDAPAGPRARPAAASVSAAPRRVRVTARDEGGAPVWSDTTTLTARPAAPTGGIGPGPARLHAAVVALPVSPLPFGLVALDVRPLDASSSDASSTGAPVDDAAVAGPALLVSFGDDLPAASLAQGLEYLRFFATPERLRALRDAPTDRRAATWADFLRATDPVASTPEHEALRDYVARLRTANARFREERTPGWLTDRGRAFLALGEPDEILDPNDADRPPRGRVQVWRYLGARLALQFTDATGFGRWRLAPASAAEVEAALRRQMVR